MNIETVRARLEPSGWDVNLEMEGDRIYFRYDTDDNTVKENESTYFDISEDLAIVGYRIDEPCIEHNCITGYVVEKEKK